MLETQLYNSSVKFAYFLALTLPLGAQPLTVYTELAHIDAKGAVIQPATPREILSPGVVRNGFTSFQIVVNAPEGTSWELYVAQNPANAVDVTLYREAGARAASGMKVQHGRPLGMWPDPGILDGSVDPTRCAGRAH